MKNLYILFVAILLGSLVLVGVPAAAQNSGAWVVVHDIQVEHATNVAGFLTEDFGVTIGYAGEKHYTTDGGETWPEAENESACRFGLDIVDEHVLWSVGNGGGVRLSTDSGQTWTAVSDVSDHGISRYASFLDDQTGWVANTNHLWETVDSGETWTEFSLPEETENMVASVAMLESGTGYLLGFNRNLYFTEDSGETWTAQPLNLSDDRKISVSISPAMRFFDTENGMIVARIKDAGIIALRTEDAGTTWTEEEIPMEEIASSGTLYLSQDGSMVTYTDTNGHIMVAEYTADEE
jgi:photosystem II stability/assembly factor-like uncharacterized protein